MTDNCTVADLTLDTYEVGGVVCNGICSERDAVEDRGVTFDVVHDGQNSSTAVNALHIKKSCGVLRNMWPGKSKLDNG